jgi:hypothetical protein
MFKKLAPTESDHGEIPINKLVEPCFTSSFLFFFSFFFFFGGGGGGGVGK